MTPRVAITGVGAVSALGLGVPSLWQGLLEGRSGIAALQAVRSPHLRATMAAEVPGFVPEQHLADRDFNELDRFAQLALAAAREAWDGAGLRGHAGDPGRVAVVTGSAVGGMGSEEEAYERLYAAGKPRASPLTVPRVMGSAAASRLAREFGATGPCASFSSACAASSHAIAHGALLIAAGRADVALVGGSEAPLTLGHLLAWDALRVLSAGAARPFDEARDGTTLGEGAAFLVLESLAHARRRGATVLAALAGVGESCDAASLTAADADGAARALRACLADAGLPPSAVGYVNAHGTATAMNDRTEAAALRAVFGARTAAPEVDALPPPGPWVSSTKGAHGHLLGAAGAMEAVVTIQALRTGIVPPTVGCRRPDAACGLRIALQPQQAQLAAAVSTTLAFGGLNVALAFLAAPG